MFTTLSFRIGSFCIFEVTAGDSIQIYTGVVWVFANISGMISILPDGTINSINQNFASMLFGYSEIDLIGQVPHASSYT